MSMRDIRETPAIKGLVSDIEDKRRTYNAVTNGETDSVKIFRAQGAIEALDAVLEMIDADPIEYDEDEDRLPL